MPQPVDLQRQTLRLYGELVSRNDKLAGKLVLACGEGAASTGLAAAAAIAGATSLLVDPDPAAVKRVFRQGGVDFVVNTLDEALRILKNEIRKQTPVSVALPADTHAVLTEIAERGVLPDVHVAVIPGSPADRNLSANLRELQQAGMSRIRLERQDEGQSTMLAPSRHLGAWLTKHHWKETSTNGTAAQALLEKLPLTDVIRRRWIERAPQYLRVARNGVEWVWD